MDLVKIDKRIKELNDISSLSSLSKREDTLKNSLYLFLPLLRKDCRISNCTSKGDFNHFLVWKYDFGKSLVNKKNCTLLGTKNKKP